MNNKKRADKAYLHEAVIFSSVYFDRNIRAYMMAGDKTSASVPASRGPGVPASLRQTTEY